MGTIIVTAGGFTNLPVTAPSGWPATLTWPSGQSPNGSRTFTASDADFQTILVWTANINTPQLPQAPTAAQVLQVWVQGLVTSTVHSVQNFFTPSPQPPPPINVT